MYQFTIGQTQIMGILNVTPDSFSDGGRFFSVQAAVDRAVQIEQEGADILDIGAQSTRPGSVAIPPAEELRRLLPVLDALRDKLRIPISIDTFYPAVALAALERGAVIVNNVSGWVSRDFIWATLGYGAGLVLVRNACRAGGGIPLPEMVELALEFGLKKQQLCIDPGLGFTASREEDFRLLAQTQSLKMEGIAYLVGASRKRFTGEGVLPGGRLAGSIAAQTVAQLGGADILRVHDVKEAVQAVNLTKEVQRIFLEADNLRIDTKAKTL